MDISHIHLHWSESPFFVEEDREYYLHDFEFLAERSAFHHPPGGGYYKTKVSVVFKHPDDEPWLVRLDLAPQDTHSLAHYVRNRLRLYDGDSAPSREKTFLEDLTEAYARYEA